MKEAPVVWRDQGWMVMRDSDAWIPNFTVRANDLLPRSCNQMTPTAAQVLQHVDTSLPGESKTTWTGGGFLARHRVASLPMRLDTNRRN